MWVPISGREVGLSSIEPPITARGFQAHVSSFLLRALHDLGEAEYPVHTGGGIGDVTDSAYGKQRGFWKTNCRGPLIALHSLTATNHAFSALEKG